MKKLFIIIIIFISFQSLAKADVRDFEVEGISVGDSLLDHFYETEITDKTTRATKVNVTKYE